MRTIGIKEKLALLGVDYESVNLGMFDEIAEITAKRTRNMNDPLYYKHGCFYRSNYERGILAYYLVKKEKLSSVLEIGFGRGYFSVCCAVAMMDAGIDGKITTVDIKFDKQHLEMMLKCFGPEIMGKLTFIQGNSEAALKSLPVEDKFDLIYLDGDHRYDFVKSDWELTKDKWNKYYLFDDYKEVECDNIQVKRHVDTVEHPRKELIIMDRRLYADDRRMTDDEMNYGQVLLTNESCAGWESDSDW